MPLIGYTTGVYDMFHVGHLRLLERAAQACDELVVGVTTDALAATRKARPPVIPLEDRMAIIGALSCVDRVVAQDSMDKLAAWEVLRFERMFVGDDWKGTPQWQALEAAFAPKGVEIIYFPYTPTISSSRLRAAVEPDLTGEVG